jgi:hypothetical protein
MPRTLLSVYYAKATGGTFLLWDSDDEFKRIGPPVN